jgi:hypothetical protein
VLAIAAQQRDVPEIAARIDARLVDAVPGQ